MQIKLPTPVKIIIDRFERAGHEIYIVGGVVRDLLIDRAAYDWDFTTDATPEVILSLFPDGFYDNRFGTVGLKIGKPPVYEITTFRKEIGYSDKRHPDHIHWGKTLADDLLRRDFTINAMALRAKLSGQASKQKVVAECELIDLHGGQKDLKAKLIRAVGNPDERFEEDALRMIRAVRIATQLGFRIEAKTLTAIQKRANLLNYVSNERKRDELLKLLASPGAADGYLLLRESGLAKELLPEIEKSFGVEQKSPQRHHKYDVGTHLVESLRYSPTKDPVVNLAILLHDVGKPAVAAVKEGIITFYNHELVSTRISQKIGLRLRLSKKQQKLLTTLVRWHQFSVDDHQSDKALKRFLRKVGPENLQAMLQLRTADRLGGGAKETSWRLEKFKKRLAEVQKQPFSITDLKINGNDIMTVLKIQPGPVIGKILNQLLVEVEDKAENNNRDYLLTRVKQIAAELE